MGVNPLSNPYNRIDAVQEDFSIEYLREYDSYNMPYVHYHDGYEIYYQLSGERIYLIRDEIYHIHAGDLVLLKPYEEHRTMAAGSKFGRVLLTFSEDYAEGLSGGDIDLLSCFRSGRNRLTLPLARQVAVEKLLLDMVDENRLRGPGYRTALRLGLMQLLLTASRILAGERQASPGVNPIHETIKNAMQYIQSHYEGEIRLKSLADRYNISYFYFCRVFREVTGFTLTEYVNCVRIKQAMQLIRETKLSITEIAGMAGFESSTYFERVFKGLMQVSPREYRKGCRECPPHLYKLPG